MALPGVHDVELRALYVAFDAEEQLARVELRWRRIDEAGEPLIGFTAQEVLEGAELQALAAEASGLQQWLRALARRRVAQQEGHRWAQMGIGDVRLVAANWQAYAGEDQGFWFRYERMDRQRGQPIPRYVGELLVEEKNGLITANNGKAIYDDAQAVAEFRREAEQLARAGYHLVRKLEGF